MNKKPAAKVYFEKDKSLLDNSYLETINDEYYISTNGLFDLNTLNMGQLVQNVQDSINKKPSRFLIFRNRENEKIKLETEKVQYLIKQISSLRDLGMEMLSLQADALLTPKIITYLLEDKKQKFENEFELNVEKHFTDIHTERANRRFIDQQISDREADIKRKIAEVEFLNSLTEEQKANASFLEKIPDCLDKMSNEAVAYMFHSFITRNKSNESPAVPKDFSMDEFLRETMKEKVNEDVKARKYENISNKAKATFDKWKTDVRMKEHAL